MLQYAYGSRVDLSALNLSGFLSESHSKFSLRLIWLFLVEKGNHVLRSQYSIRLFKYAL